MAGVSTRIVHQLSASNCQLGVVYLMTCLEKKRIFTSRARGSAYPIMAAGGAELARVHL